MLLMGDDTEIEDVLLVTFLASIFLIDSTVGFVISACVTLIHI